MQCLSEKNNVLINIYANFFADGLKFFKVYDLRYDLERQAMSLSLQTYRCQFGQR